ncbi:PilT/PilU family type 4a pilus ATPase [Noviherbaspirillum pedocola]|uniref:PilT/PilU family type 4a pilus ATPase n=1 Tax=Noviherbaspirillum pedocola TaxID=2801341 RepID=A0A934SX82_9BURK|nr:PilT/PilU family type 4a pilus ATPase [Noviherbaspirillum pedocola]MBK4734522.1 PilT/PilU family type 4a pilus ATPase [Noviherbaspirillum pedocola]
MPMDRLFRLMKDKAASDLFLTVDSPIHIKIGGVLVPVNQQRLDAQNIEALLREVVPLQRIDELRRERELNMGIPVAGVGRMRLSAFIQRGTISAVFRYVPDQIPAIDDLYLPPVLSSLIMEKRGLLLVVGSTGSGKSTTIAAMLDHRNAMSTGHILTLEDPIEYQFTARRSVINQREIGTDAESLNIALKNALRQAPDCILIGEIRDRDTMSAALSYAQSGHLVVATLHANNSYQALNRIISFYPIESRQALYPDLAATLRAIVSQRLIPATHGGRRPAVEVMLNTRHVAELIEAAELTQVREAIEKSLSAGSQTFEMALMQMIREGVIGEEEALAHADSASNLYWLLHNAEKEQEEQQQKQENPQEPTFTEFTLNL